MDQNKYFAEETTDSAERERLAAIEAAKDPKTKRHLAELGVAPGWRCLEVGGGGGSITRWLADRVGPSGRVVAADIDTRFLQEINKANVEARKLDILKDAIEDSAFDVVHCRLLLIHLSDPELALNRMVSAAKRGGWVMVEEADFSSYRAADPNHPLSEAFTRIVQETFANVKRSNVFDPYFGRRVRDLVGRAGLSDLGNEGTAYLWRGGEAEAREHRLSLPIFVKAGVCTESDALTVAKALADPKFTFVGHTIFSAWGKRVA